MKWLCLCALTVLSLGACGRPSSENSPDRAIASIQCSTGVSQPWSCLEQACATAGGQIDGRSHECKCANGGVFVGWKSPRCVSSRPEVSSARVDISNKFEQGLSTEVKISFPEGAEQITLTSAAAMATTHNFPVFGQRRVQSFVPLKSSTSSELLERYLFAPPPPTRPGDTAGQSGMAMQLVFPERVYYSSLEELYSILQSNDFFEPERDSAPSGLKYSRAFNAALQAHEFIETVIPFVDLGCLGACEVHRKFTAPQFPGFEFEQTTYWSGGAPYRNFTNISPTGKLPVASIFQSAHGRPLVYAEYQDVQTNGHQTRIAQFYGSDGRALGEHRFETDYTQALVAPTSTTADVLMCEPWFGPEWKNDELQKHLVRGPGKSLWGWNTPKSDLDFFSGFRPISPMGFFDYTDLADPTAFEQYTHHFESVLEQIVGHDDLKVAPIAPVDCEHHAILTSNSQSVNLPRIISYSTLDYRSPEACKTAFPELKTTPFLWILAAGNEGFGDFKRSQMICPQNTVPPRNRIIVGAVDFDGNVEHYSNQNPNYIDIYAPGKPCNPDGDCSETPGTSFAAPRVAHVAAKLLKAFPQMSNEQIRMAILMGADESYNLPAASHGILSEEGAFKFAKSILATASYEAAVKDYYPAYYWRARPKKLAILAEILKRAN